ncbi:hypothetical protein D3C78_1566540 [compost metagenome]
MYDFGIAERNHRNLDKDEQHSDEGEQTNLPFAEKLDKAGIAFAGIGRSEPFGKQHQINVGYNANGDDGPDHIGMKQILGHKQHKVQHLKAIHDQKDILAAKRGFSLEQRYF